MKKYSQLSICALFLLGACNGGGSHNNINNGGGGGSGDNNGWTQVSGSILSTPFGASFNSNNNKIYFLRSNGICVLEAIASTTQQCNNQILIKSPEFLNTISIDNAGDLFGNNPDKVYSYSNDNWQILGKNSNTASSIRGIFVNSKNSYYFMQSDSGSTFYNICHVSINQDSNTPYICNKTDLIFGKDQNIAAISTDDNSLYLFTANSAVSSKIIKINFDGTNEQQLLQINNESVNPVSAYITPVINNSLFFAAQSTTESISTLSQLNLSNNTITNIPCPMTTSLSKIACLVGGLAIDQSTNTLYGVFLDYSNSNTYSHYIIFRRSAS